MKTVFVIDWALVPSFIFSAVTGVGLHLAGHENSHEIWHNWAIAHITASLLFTIFVIAHIRTHWGWYKSLFRNGIGRKSHVTVYVSVLFAAVALTGFALLGINGAGSGLGIWHWGMGLLSLVLFSGHIIKRLPVLRKSVRKQQ